MKTDYLQEEKNDIIKLVQCISVSISSLKFFNMHNCKLSDEFKKEWKVTLSKFFSDLNNYQNNVFPIVVLGRWNSGKSTLINSVIGKEILPSANREMTSILTNIVYGEKENASVVYLSDEKIHINISDVKDFISFRGVNYREDIKQIDISVNSSELRNGTYFIDTPGLSSINELNNKIAYEIIPCATSVILTISGLDVGGEENYNLIKRIFDLKYDKNNNLIFVITKYDLLNKKALDEAKESLEELIMLAKKQLNQPYLINSFNICAVSPYLELKYRQYKNSEINEEDILKDATLHISSIDNIESLKTESNFIAFKELLINSIINSNNKKQQTNNLYIIIQSTLSSLLQEYREYFEVFKGDKTVIQVQEKLNAKVEIIKNIKIEGNQEILEFKDNIKELETQKFDLVKNMIDLIYQDTVKYINDTPYEIISKDKFTNLNNQINTISVKQATYLVESINNNLKSLLDNSLRNISNIIQKNQAELAKEFNYADYENINSSFYGIKVKSNFALSSLIISLAASTTAGVGLFNIGSAVFPVIGSIVGGILGGLLGFLASMLKLSNNARKKEIMISKIYKYLHDKEYVFTITIRDLCEKYHEIGNLLEDLLASSLKAAIVEKNNIMENYEESKKIRNLIKQNLIDDMKIIEDLALKTNSYMGKYINKL